MKPEVTFFIPVRNGAAYIDECIGSILAQTYRNWRLLILDNQSTDNTRALCEKYLSDPRVSYVLNDTDIGAYGNLNKCLDLCDTRYYAILSHDDLYSCNRAVEESMALLDSDPELCATYSAVYWIDEASRVVARRRSRYVGKVPTEKVGRKSIVKCRNLFGVPLLVRSTTAAGKKYTSELYHTADVDFSIATGRGMSVYIIDRPCYSIRFHARNSSARDYSGILPQMRRIAERHGIGLTSVDRMKMKLNSFQQSFGKFLFFLYLDHFRQRGNPRKA